MGPPERKDSRMPVTEDDAALTLPPGVEYPSRKASRKSGGKRNRGSRVCYAAPRRFGRRLSAAADPCFRRPLA
jgi:hypothetical protein